ncbi:hypothetical protein [Filifactor villosus]|uniref:DUF3592 domain-containing protein n=1 Tax=Filifactor villosus TaxID=29374 RepID=A0ABV9QI45_9FIRM
MAYVIALILFLFGLSLPLISRRSADLVKDIKALLADDTNRQETKGTLQVIEIKSSRYDFECYAKVVFTNHNGKTFRYKETFSSSNSKASFLWKCKNKGKVPISVIYDKRSPARHFIRELKPLEVNKNSKVAYTLIGILFMLLGLFIIGAERSLM